MTTLTENLAAELSCEIDTMRPLSGGDTAEAFAVTLADGRRLFAKTHAAPPAGFFSREADDLFWLRSTETLAVPQVLAVSDQHPAHLALEWIETGGRHRSDDADFGRRLARLHRAGAPTFGRSDSRTTGSLGLPNEPCTTWAEFFATQRLLPLANIASDRGALARHTIGDLERITARLDQLSGPPEPPARLHGDLWAGNRVIDTDGRSWLIDPAAHGGHREFDLAMMRLFGGFGDEAFVAYHDEHPLADGWAGRIPLHQLAPLVVHAIKFGGGYVGAVEDALARLH